MKRFEGLKCDVCGQPAPFALTIPETFHAGRPDPDFEVSAGADWLVGFTRGTDDGLKITFVGCRPEHADIRPRRSELEKGGVTPRG